MKLSCCPISIPAGAAASLSVTELANSLAAASAVGDADADSAPPVVTISQVQEVGLPEGLTDAQAAAAADALRLKACAGRMDSCDVAIVAGTRGGATLRITIEVYDGGRVVSTRRELGANQASLAPSISPLDILETVRS